MPDAITPLVPGPAPTVVTITPVTVTIAWKDPSGGVEPYVSQLQVRLRGEGEDAWQNVIDVTISPAKVRGRIPKLSYEFRVKQISLGIAPGPVDAVQMSGVGAGVGDGSTLLQVIAQLTGTGSGIGSGSALLQIALQLSGAGTGIGSGSATFGVVVEQITGTATGTGSGSALLQTIPQLTGTATGLGSGSATFGGGGGEILEVWA